MRSGVSSLLLLGIVTCFSSAAHAQQCPTPIAEADGFYSIQLQTVALKMRPGKTSTDLVLTHVSPLTGETETHRATITTDGSIEQRTALLQVNRYGLELENLAIEAEVLAVLAAGYTPTGSLNIGYGAQEGGFLFLSEGTPQTSGCYPYPENAAFGDWTKAISIIDLDFQQLSSRFATLRAELQQCRAQNATLSTQGTSLESTNAALREQVRSLEAALAIERATGRRRVFDLSRVIRSIFNEAQDNVKTKYPGDRQALSVLRKQLVVARKANRRNITTAPNVVQANRESLRRSR